MMKKLLIIGGGRRGKGLLEILSRYKDIEIVAMVDLSDSAPGMKLARSYGIPTYNTYTSLFDKEKIDIVLNVSGDQNVFAEVSKLKDEKTEILGGVTANLLSDVLLERHEALLTTSAQKAEIDSILKGLGEGVLVVDNRRNVILINPPACKLLGIKDDLKRLVPKEHGSIIEILNRVIDTKDRPIVEEIEYTKRIENREIRKIFNIVASRIDDEKGDLLAIATIIRDITAEKEIERMKSELIANVSHELRTPLTSINNAVYLIETATSPSGKTQRFLSIIRKNSERLLRVINNLLDISRIESGMLDIEMDLVSVYDVIEDSIVPIRSLANSKKIEIVVDIHPLFPEIYANKEGLEHIFSNLLSNAIKFTDEGGKVSISCREKEEEVHLAVEDTGVGIPPEEIDKVFDKFSRATTASGIEGTGLGLAIVKHFVNLHKGRIWVESEVNKGTRFTISLPKIDKYFHLSLQEEMFRAKTEETFFSILLLRLTDIDAISEEEERERLLRRIEERVREEIHRSDKVIRYKDKGFFIILLRAGKQEAEKVAHRLKSFVDGAGFSEKIVLSYGVATFPEDGDSEEKLLEKIGALF
jgi:two-component system phosphate regulon sensor histidine kinase PhoR